MSAYVRGYFYFDDGIVMIRATPEAFAVLKKEADAIAAQLNSIWEHKSEAEFLLAESRAVFDSVLASQGVLSSITTLGAAAFGIGLGLALGGSTMAVIGAGVALGYFGDWLYTRAVEAAKTTGERAGEAAFDLWGPKVDEDSNAYFSAARSVVVRRDPLILDLDGDGLELTAASGSVLFDHNADGIKAGTGWVRPDDGLMVRDLNGNGSIDSGRELFGVDTLKRNGQYAAHGFDALGDLDTNADGQLTSADRAWRELKVWQDVNQDGVSQAAEIKTLDQLGITRVGVKGENNGPQAGQNLNNNFVELAGTFTRNGAMRGLGAVDLEANAFFSEIPPEVVDENGLAVTVTDAALALPQMNGSGMVRNLRAAVSLSGTAADALESSLAAFTAAPTRDAQRAVLDGLITDWARTSSYWNGLEGYLGGSVVLTMPVGGSEADFRNVLAVLEAFNGSRFYGAVGEAMPAGQQSNLNGAIAGFTLSPPAEQLALLRKAYDSLKESVYGALIMQTRLRPYLDKVGVGMQSTGLHLDFSGADALFASRAAADANHAIHDLLDMNEHAGDTLKELGWNPWHPLQQALQGASLTQEVRERLSNAGIRYAAPGTTFTEGQLKDSVLIGTNGAEVLNAHDAEYVYGGAGDDCVYATNLSGGVTLDGGSGNDKLGYAAVRAGAGTFIGGRGDDSLSGGRAGDVYRFDFGDGRDTITEYGAADEGTMDILRFGAGISPSDVAVRRDGLDLIFEHSNGSDRISVKRWFEVKGPGYQLERIEFADGSVWSAAEVSVRALEVFGGNGDDVLTGTDNNVDVLRGGAGNDTLKGAGIGDTLDGGAGNDLLRAGNVGAATFKGGLGNDTMEGGHYADTYLFMLGDGRDSITEIAADARYVDVLRFGAGISSTDIRAVRLGHDLVLSHKNGTDELTVKQWFKPDVARLKQLELVEFADGTFWTGADLTRGALEKSGTADADTLIGIAEYADILHGGPGADTLTAVGSGDTLHGGAGNDRLVGTTGSDLYLFDLGDGQDEIAEYRYGPQLTGAVDTLRFGAGIRAADLTARRSQQDLVFEHTNGSDRIVVKSWYDVSYTDLQIERIEFAGGSFMTSDQAAGLTQTQQLLHAMAAFQLPAASTSGASSISSSSYAPTIVSPAF